jgi:diguanylate cyclase (GGDEF)-like protein
VVTSKESVPSLRRVVIRRRHTQSDKLLAFLAGLAVELATVLELPALLQHIIRAVREQIGFDSCAVSLLECHDDQDVLVVKAGSGLRSGVTGLRFPRGQGLVWEVLHSQTPIIVPDLHADPRVLRRDPGVRSGMYTPLVSRRGPIGVLSAYSAEVNGFAAADLHLLTIVAQYIASAVEVSQLHEALRTAAATDSLTSLANRRTCMDRLRHEVARCERTHRPLSIVLLDLDGLKAINDTYGHAAGDAFLVEASRAVTRALRSLDLAARFGGDEFVLVLPETERAEAQRVIARLERIAVPLPGKPAREMPLRFSWGLATWPADGAAPDQLLQVADLRLYHMKEQHKLAARRSSRRHDP